VDKAVAASKKNDFTSLLAKKIEERSGLTNGSVMILFLSSGAKVILTDDGTTKIVLEDSKNLSTRAIVGIVLGSVTLIAIVGILYYMRRVSRGNKKLRKSFDNFRQESMSPRKPQQFNINKEGRPATSPQKQDVFTFTISRGQNVDNSAKLAEAL